jgi:hypothetical protein
LCQSRRLTLSSSNNNYNGSTYNYNNNNYNGGTYNNHNGSTYNHNYNGSTSRPRGLLSPSR